MKSVFRRTRVLSSLGFTVVSLGYLLAAPMGGSTASAVTRAASDDHVAGTVQLGREHRSANVQADGNGDRSRSLYSGFLNGGYMPAGATSAVKTTVSHFVASPSSFYSNGGIVSLSAQVTNASSCVFSSAPHVAGLPVTVACSNGTVENPADLTLPANTGKTAVTYHFTLAVTGTTTVRKTAKAVVVPPLGGVASIAGGFESYCASLTSGGVDCWGYNEFGELGDGTTVSGGPVAVVGLGGTGTLSGVASITSDGYETYCALLTSGGVDCWGYGYDGNLGDGQFYNVGPEGSPVPVAVEGVGGAGTLSGVASLTGSNGTGLYGEGYCAVLTSGGVDCWGYGQGGQLGDDSTSDSDVPVVVDSFDGASVVALTGVVSLVANLDYGGDGGFCAVLSSGGVDCWGSGSDGASDFSDVAVPMVGVGGDGFLTGVASLTSAGSSYCALSTSGGVDCWGNGGFGNLGNGTYNSSTVPVQVQGVGGAGTLTGVASLASYDGNSPAGYCALLTSGKVDCWGYGYDGELGNGVIYSTSPYGSAVPVKVEGVGGTGTLTGVTSIASSGESFCARLGTGRLDCWGYSKAGQLGNGVSYPTSPFGSPVPVKVTGVGGVGTLAGVVILTNDGIGYCALLTSGKVDCWGAGENASELGNAPPQDSDVPVRVSAPPI